jgi:hypothetical protein
MFVDEYARARGLVSATTLLDVRKCFELVVHRCLYKEAIFQDFPWALLRLSMSVYNSERRCKVGLAMSSGVWANSTVVAGCGFAVYLLRAYTMRALDKVSAFYPQVIVRNIVDDISLQAFGVHKFVSKELGNATLYMCNELEWLEMDLQPAKCDVIKREARLGRVLEKILKPRGIVHRPHARLLGADYVGAGRALRPIR